ncbi:MAG TPA: ATP synthase F1 subunit delta [Terriglobia bacterium]|nr:ATP synthase F1 subunit delta [Terriglobia bacterium]
MSVAANRYAKALMDVLYPNDAETGLIQLDGFVAILATEPEATQVLENPTVSIERRQALLNKIADAAGFIAPVRRFLDLLVARNRMDLLGDVVAAYRKFLDERMGVVRAHVTSAQPLDDSEQSALRAKLEQATGRQVRMEVSVDPALIGGVVAQVGSTIYDGSMRQQLKTFRNRMTAK